MKARCIADFEVDDLIKFGDVIEVEECDDKTHFYQPDIGAYWEKNRFEMVPPEPTIIKMHPFNRWVLILIGAILVYTAFDSLPIAWHWRILPIGFVMVVIKKVTDPVEVKQ